MSALRYWPFRQWFLPLSQPSHCHALPALGPFMCAHVTSMRGAFPALHWVTRDNPHTHSTFWTHSQCWEQWRALFQFTSCHQTPGLKSYYMMRGRRWGNNTLIASSPSQSRLGYGQDLRRPDILMLSLELAGFISFYTRVHLFHHSWNLYVLKASKWINKSDK